MSITPLPDAPLISDSTATFNTKAFALAAALVQMVNEINAEIPAIDGAYPASLVSIGSANYKGDWSTLTGALNIPASCSYGSRIWLLTSNLANVAAAQPGVSSSWLDITPTKVSFKNRIINGHFAINQRAYTSGVAKSAGIYMHDRWKAGASGCTYTFTAGSVGVPVTVTITAGSLQQVIEGCHLPEGGTYTLSWTGTAQAKVAGGAYAASPIVVTGLTAGANCTVEFNTGTVGMVQFEPGSIATASDFRDYGRELVLCQRYYSTVLGLNYAGYNPATTGCIETISLPVSMRVMPTANAVGSPAYSNCSAGAGHGSALSNATAQLYVVVTANGGFQFSASSSTGYSYSAEL